MKQMAAAELNETRLAGLATDGANVMIGKNNGVAALLRRECKLMLNVHCICHRLALACADASCIKTVGFCHPTSNDYTLDQIAEIAVEKKPLRKFQKDLGEGGRLITTEISLTPTAESYLENLTVKYTDALKDNINNRFSDKPPRFVSM